MGASSSAQTTFEYLRRVFDVLNFLQTFSKDRRTMRKGRTRVQDVRVGMIRLKETRDSREHHKGFRGQLRHRYFAGRIRRH